MMRRGILLLALSAPLCLGGTGCYLTKVVSVPVRVAGAVTSLVPMVGNRLHDALDGVADSVDALPL